MTGDSVVPEIHDIAPAAEFTAAVRGCASEDDAILGELGRLS